MRIDLLKTAQLIRSNDNILILTHKNPDGDAMGSAFALCRTLCQFGKRVTFKFFDKIPQMPLKLLECSINENFEFDFIVAVDTADAKILGDDVDNPYKDRVDLSIDHHPSNTFFAKNTYLEETAAATAELILLIARELGVEPDVTTAEGIYLGLSTDTGCFRYSNTTSRTLRMAADMVDTGIDLGEINQLMFETKSKSYAELESMALSTIKMYFGGRCAIMHISQKMYEKSGSDETEIHSLSSLPRQIEGVLAGVTIKESDQNSYKVSVRTKAPLDAAEICSKMGGGGHKRAAGCEIKGTFKEARDLVKKTIKEALKGVKAE